MRAIGDFLGANLFLLAIIGMGAATTWALGAAVLWTLPDADELGWPWILPLAGAIAAMYFGGRALYRLIDRLLYSPARRAASGARSGVARPGDHHHS